jgi:hypothetical protein
MNVMRSARSPFVRWAGRPSTWDRRLFSRILRLSAMAAPHSEPPMFPLHTRCAPATNKCGVCSREAADNLPYHHIGGQRLPAYDSVRSSFEPPECFDSCSDCR